MVTKDSTDYASFLNGDVIDQS